MGPEQIKAARYYAGTDLFFESAPWQSEATTFSSDSTTTDSAAAATAIATGEKVDNGFISTESRGTSAELETILEYFKAKDKRVGLVTTAYMTHATPAAFGAHETSRNNISEIAFDYLNQTLPNILFGGGGNGMTIESALAAGYTVVTDSEGLFALDTDNEVFVSGQFGNTHLPYEYDGLGPLPHLSDMATVALDVLDNDPDGFFLMIEGGRIDHACHVNDLSRCIFEILEFSVTVETVFNWIQGRDDTLLIVTADHETGGLTDIADNGPGIIPEATWGSFNHTSTMVPVYAYGLNAELAAAISDNTEIHTLMMSEATVSEQCLGAGISATCQLALTWTANSNAIYHVESTHTLTPASWQYVATITATSHRVTFNTSETDNTGNYYRLISTGISTP